jgi:hypothetical protein
VSTVFLFGAGASYGCGNAVPSPPPLGAGLYDELRAVFPNTWGALPTPEEDKAFRGDPPFEAGMMMLWDKRDERLQLLLCDMGVYFAQFALADDRNCYSALIKSLAKRDALSTAAFCTLNYECLFEYAAAAVGFQVEIAGKSPGRLTLIKPHGACNLFPSGFGTNLRIENSRMSGMNAYFEGPLKSIHPTKVGGLYTKAPHYRLQCLSTRRGSRAHPAHRRSTPLERSGLGTRSVPSES